MGDHDPRPESPPEVPDRAGTVDPGETLADGTCSPGTPDPIDATRVEAAGLDRTARDAVMTEDVRTGVHDPSAPTLDGAGPEGRAQRTPPAIPGYEILGEL